MSIQKNKEQLLTTSDTFCMAPWVHIHTSPTGIAAPCCIASGDYEKGVGNSREQSLIQIVNSDKMNQLRLDMLNGVKNSMCSTCHNHEEHGVDSFRKSFNKEQAKHFDESLSLTKEDGSLSEFKMRYFDIRFSNICNFKCRTCNSSFSTQWELEDKRNERPGFWVIPKNNRKELVDEVLEHIEHINIAYFAGGEPLITEEHYIILEEMIRQGRTDIALRYNTNLSNLRFKDKDLLGLWKQFTNGVFVYASIDHYGERAEYIRHGTDWAKVEENFIAVKNIPDLHVQMNTVLSVYNYMTLGEFYQYLVDKNLYSPTDLTYSLYNMITPTEMAAHILPVAYKDQGKNKIIKLVKYLKNKGFNKNKTEKLDEVIPWVYSKHTWDSQKEAFWEETARLDKIRNQDFKKTFPELRGIMK
jgi:MoaA/NifB/PqqE/SkfB family radical SAM enzyme